MNKFLFILVIVAICTHDARAQSSQQNAGTRSVLAQAIARDWDHSAWVSRQIVQAGASKVHVIVVFRRFRKDNSVIADEASLYILEKINGQWGIRGRSSYAL